MARKPLAEALHNPLWCGHLATLAPVTLPTVRQLLHEERVRFLQFLAETPFPALLAWRLPVFARRLFHALPDGAVALNPRYLNDRKAAKQAARACFGYAVAALPRLAPRQAWVGQGFARVGESPCRAVPVLRECLHLEPDIAWFAKAFPDFASTPLVAGDDGWDWLERAFHGAGLHQATAWVVANKGCWQGRVFGDFADTLQWQAQLQAQWQGLGVSAGLGQGWWATRLLPEEVILPLGCLEGLVAGVKTFFGNGGEDDMPVTPMPLVWRIAQSNPEAVYCQAEEFWHWVVGNDATPSPRLASSWGQVRLSALMAEFTQGQVRVLGFDPSPARSASRAGRLLPFAPAFMANFGTVPLQIGSNLLDNRVVRPASQEFPPHALAAGEEADVRTTLMTDAVWSLFSRELASPRYACAPDLPPISVDFKGGVRLPFGWLSADGHHLLLAGESLPTLVAQVRHPLGLARLLQRWNPLFVQAAWLDVLIAGKKSCIYTACGLGFDWLLAQLGNAPRQQNVFLSVPSYPSADVPLTDTQGNALDCLLLLRHLRHE